MGVDGAANGVMVWRCISPLGNSGNWRRAGGREPGAPPSDPLSRWPLDPDAALAAYARHCRGASEPAVPRRSFAPTAKCRISVVAERARVGAAVDLAPGLAVGACFWPVRRRPKHRALQSTQRGAGMGALRSRTRNTQHPARRQESADSHADRRTDSPAHVTRKGKRIQTGALNAPGFAER